MSKSTFIHLNAHTSFSLLNAIPSAKKLALKAKDLGMPAIGITDINNIYGAVEISKTLPNQGVQPILGAQLSLRLNDDVMGYLSLLVQNRTGWQNLLTLISQANENKKEFHSPQLTWEALEANTEGLICLTGSAQDGVLAQANQDVLKRLHTAFEDRLYIEIQRHGWDTEQQLEPWLLAQAKEFDLPVVATNDPRFLEKSQYEAFDALVCIGETSTVDDPNRKQFTPEHYLKSAEEMTTLFTDIPGACQNSVEIAKRCAFSLEQVDVKQMFMPQWPVQEKEETVAEVLRVQAENGLKKRMDSYVFTESQSTEEKEALTTQYFDRLAQELKVITDMGFDGYFLITSDFIRWAKSQNIPVGPGRGSGAGSLVAWSLNITDLDPIRWDLYFERFLNPERVSLPDFDIDFCQERRDEVIHYVQEKYGHDFVSQIITFGTLKARACIRDVGRVLQMSFHQVGRIASFVPEVPNPPTIKEVLDGDKRLQEQYEQEEEVKRLIDIAMQLEGCYRHASTHAAGVIIADQPIKNVSGLYVDMRASMPATQFSMFDAEYVGLVKFDFLGLKTLTIIQKTLDTLKEKGVNLDIAHIPLDDSKVYEMLQAGHTVGVFQIESAGMTDLTKKVQPTCMEHLAAVICLFRPGPMELMPDYVACHLGQKEAHYAHPLLEPVLKETHGVAIYQEQVLRMAQVLAGFSLGEADILRRAMGKKKVEEMALQREKFVAGCATKNKIEAEQANAIFDQMAAFAGYGFNKAHTMAYTLIAYQTAYLKAYHPHEFLAACMTLDHGNTAKLLRYKQEIERMGSTLLTPDINQSDVWFKVEENKIRHALAAIKGAGADALKVIIQERQEQGPYKDVFDFLERHSPHVVSKKNWEVLVKAGAFDALEPNRALLLGNTDILLAYLHSHHEDKTSNQIGLFGEKSGNQLPRPNLAAEDPWDIFTALQHEQSVIGFFLSAHPMSAWQEEVETLPAVKPIAVLGDMARAGREGAQIAGIILAKRQMKTKTGKLMAFITISDTSGQEELVLFPEAFAQYGEMLEETDPLVADVQMSWESDRLRANIMRIVPLQEVAQQRQHIILKLSSQEAVVPLQQCLQQQEKGSTACELIVATPDAEDVRVKLTQKIRVNPQVLYNLARVPGVEVIS